METVVMEVAQYIVGRDVVQTNVRPFSRSVSSSTARVLPQTDRVPLVKVRPAFSEAILLRFPT